MAGNFEQWPLMAWGGNANRTTTESSHDPNGTIFRLCYDMNKALEREGSFTSKRLMQYNRTRKISDRTVRRLLNGMAITTFKLVRRV